VEAVGAMEVIISPVTTMVSASRSLPVWTSRRWPARIRVRLGDWAMAGSAARSRAVAKIVGRGAMRDLLFER